MLIPNQARQKRREGVTTRKSKLKSSESLKARFFHAEISTKAKLLENGIITIDIMKELLRWVIKMKLYKPQKGEVKKCLSISLEVQW